MVGCLSDIHGPSDTRIIGRYQRHLLVRNVCSAAWTSNQYDGNMGICVEYFVHVATTLHSTIPNDTVLIIPHFIIGASSCSPVVVVE